MFVINKIMSFFTYPLNRKEVIYTQLEPFLQHLIYKYDYVLGIKANIFLKNEAMTTLPNDKEVIAYSNNRFRVLLHI